MVVGGGYKYNQKLTDFNFQLTKSIRKINHSSLALKPVHDSIVAGLASALQRARALGDTEHTHTHISRNGNWMPV